jgi:hypothetical protein
MKYLKLITKEPLDVIDKKTHITFAYFGNEHVYQMDIRSDLQNIRPFELRATKDDLFGDNKDIPVVVYEPVSSNVSNIREKMLINFGPKILVQNYPKWKPHISKSNMEQIKSLNLETIHVIGVESNDGTFSLLFD